MSATSRRRSIARCTARPALTKKRTLTSPAVIGVSTEPGSSVTTATPDRASRLEPFQRPVETAFRSAVEIIALAAPVTRDRGDHGDAAGPGASNRLASRVMSSTVGAHARSSCAALRPQEEISVRNVALVVSSRPCSGSWWRRVRSGCPGAPAQPSLCELGRRNRGGTRGHRR